MKTLFREQRSEMNDLEVESGPPIGNTMGGNGVQRAAVRAHPSRLTLLEESCTPSKQGAPGD